MPILECNAILPPLRPGTSLCCSDDNDGNAVPLAARYDLAIAIQPSLRDLISCWLGFPPLKTAGYGRLSLRDRGGQLPKGFSRVCACTFRGQISSFLIRLTWGKSIAECRDVTP